MRNIEQLLDGGYAGLYGEVVTCDTYKVRSLPFIPDIVYDIGANVGIFTRFARQLWPSALIIAVEPHPQNIADFKGFTPADDRIILLEGALGNDLIYHVEGAVNGSGECYLSETLGYRGNHLRQGGRIQPSTVCPLPLRKIVLPYRRPFTRAILKLDCEGAENCLWEDSAAMTILHSMDYLAMELHYYSGGGKEQESVRTQTDAALKTFEPTHFIQKEANHFWATRKE